MSAKRVQLIAALTGGEAVRALVATLKKGAGRSNLRYQDVKCSPSSQEEYTKGGLRDVAVVLGSHFGVGAPPILEPILVGIGMFTGGTRF